MKARRKAPLLNLIHIKNRLMPKLFSKFSLIIGAFLMVIALDNPLINAQAQTQSAEEYLEQGINLSEQNEFVDAIAAYTKAIKVDPNNPIIYYNRGLALYHLREHQAALADFDKTIELKSDAVPAYKNRGLILMYLEDYEGAIADFEIAVQLAPQDFETFAEKGFATLLNGDTKKAIADFDRAIELNPNAAIAHFVRGAAYAELGDRTNAIADYQQAAIIYQNIENTAYFERTMAIVRDLLPSCYPKCNQTTNNDTIPTDSDLLATSRESAPIANLGDRISFGSRILISELTNPDKQAGVKAFAAGDFANAVTKLEASLKQYPNDPEALIYLNNARIGNNKSLSLAVSVPIDSVTPIGLSMLQGVAQAQAETNDNGGIGGIGLKIAIAGDSIII